MTTNVQSHINKNGNDIEIKWVKAVRLNMEGKHTGKGSQRSSCCVSVYLQFSLSAS